MKRIVFALAAAVLATGAQSVSAATLNVPVNGGAVVAQLGWDSTNASSSDEAASVRITNDGTALVVRFDVPQRETLIGSAGGDDVAVSIWPAGSGGDLYRLGLNLDGTRTSDSTANTASWNGTVATHPGGYTAEIKIPLNSVPGIGSGASRVQFSRWIASTGDLQVWSHDGHQSSDDVAQAGTLTFAAASDAASR